MTRADQTPPPTKGEVAANGGGRGLKRRRQTLANARILRRNMTRAERLLWSRIRRQQVMGFRFRRQYPIGPFIADFCCVERQLIIELDGSHHGLIEERDRRRGHWLQQHGYHVLRIPNHEIFSNLEDVLRRIGHALAAWQDIEGA